MNAAGSTRRWSHPLSILLVTAALILCGGAAEARIVRIEITSKESPPWRAGRSERPASSRSSGARRTARSTRPIRAMR